MPTYLIKENFALYGDFVQNKEKNDEIRVATIPTLVATPVPPLTDDQINAYNQARENAAGQGCENDVKNTILGAWYGLTPKPDPGHLLLEVAC